jgi:replicative DNA helicase
VSEDTFERLPPHDIDAEVCALGAAMLSPDAAAEVLEMLRAEDFYRPGHQIIFRAIGAVSDSGEPVNALTVLAAAQRNRVDREWVPDGPSLHTLIARVPVASNASWFAKRVIEHARLRRLIPAGQHIIQEGYTTDPEDVDAAIERAYRALDEATQVTSSSELEPVSKMIDPFMDGLDPDREEVGLTTGWKDVDALLSGLRPGQLIAFGARPGVGKSVALTCLAYHVAVQKRLPVWAGTLEMSRGEYLARLVARDAKVNLRSLLKPKLLTDQDWARLGDSYGRMAEASTLFIDDESDMGVAHVRSALRSMRRAGRPAALGIVDYLQLMTSAARGENRQAEVDANARALKMLAKQFALPMVVAVQLNRNLEYRADKRPGLADIRESGGVENHADVVILAHREDMYDKESPRAGEIDFIVAKNRNGPTGTVTAAFQGHYARIADMAPEPDEPGSPTRILRAAS